jgi:hypothetical protein
MRTVAADKYVVTSLSRVSASSVGDQGSPDLARFGENSWVAVWPDRAGGIDAIRLQKLDQNGHKVGPETNLTARIEPVVASLSGGGFVVAWVSNSPYPDSFDVKAQIFDSAGSPVGTAFMANTRTAGFQLEPHVTGLANGGFVITWQANDDPFYDHTQGQVFTADGQKIGGEINLDDVGTKGGDKYAGEVVALTNGNFVFAWCKGGASRPRRCIA